MIQQAGRAFPDRNLIFRAPTLPFAWPFREVHAVGSNGSSQAMWLMQACDKFKMALEIEPQKHDALWCLGNAYTSQVRCSSMQMLYSHFILPRS